MNRILLISVLLVVVVLLTPFSHSDEPKKQSEQFIWSLYRNSPIDKTMRIHVATFDSIEAGSVEANFSYNKENCETASKHFSGPASVSANYWCEQGRYTN